jgi:hypothetical protein
MERQHAVKAAGLLVVVGAVAIVALSVSGGVPERAELLSPLQVGRYAVRAERQGQDYDQKAERQIAFATDNDNAASGERDLAAKEEKRARDSAYLAADTKSRIDKVLEAGRDQVPPPGAVEAVLPWQALLRRRFEERPGQLEGRCKSSSSVADVLCPIRVTGRGPVGMRGSVTSCCCLLAVRALQPVWWRTICVFGS